MSWIASRNSTIFAKIINPAARWSRLAANQVKRLSHIGADGRVRMVDVSAKRKSSRMAVASGKIRLRPETIELMEKNEIAKGNVFATARIAGIQAAKQTSDL